MSDLNRPLGPHAEERAWLAATRARQPMAEIDGPQAIPGVPPVPAPCDPIGGITETRLVALESDVAKLKTLLEKVVPYLDNLRRGRNVPE